MRLSTSTGDFSGYANTVAEKVKMLKGTKFQYINLEQTGAPTASILCESGEGWKRLADEWGEAAAYAGITYVVSHAPCLNAFETLDDETYAVTLRAVRRSIEICKILGIGRIVVHASQNKSFTNLDFYRNNKKFYSDLFDFMEKYGITVMTENMAHYMYHPLSTGKELREFVEFVDHPLFAVCWDTAHANINEKSKREGQYECIVDIGDKLKGLHISDNFGDKAHHHSWPFAGIINFDAVIQGLLDVNYDGYFNFEASYTLLHHTNNPYHRQAWEHNGKTVTRLLDPSVELKHKAVDLLYDVGKYMLETYDCFEA